MDGCADCGSVENPLLMVHETRCPECSARARFGGRPLEGERASLYCHFCGVTFTVDAAGVPLALGDGPATAAVPANQLTLFGGAS